MIRDCNLKILDVLKAKGLISTSTQRVIIGFMEKWNVDAVKAVLETHIIDEMKLADVLAEELKRPRLTRIRSMVVKKDVLELIPFELALEAVVLPFELSEQGNLHVVFADPFDCDRIKQLEDVSKKPLEIFVGERSEIIATIQRQYPLDMQLPSLLEFATAREDLSEYDQ